MPTPKIWISENALVADLSRRMIIDRDAFILKPLDTDEDWMRSIRTAVGGNTFRAFRKLPNTPSSVFRDWAFYALRTKKRFDGLATVKTQQAYDKWLKSLVVSFRSRWRRKMKDDIPFGASYKLPNLLMKEISKRLPSAQRKCIIQFLHVPLDSYTLVGISECCDSLGIPKTATMGFVSNERFYRFVQEEIRKIARQAGVPPIAYDYLAWDSSH